MLRVGRSKWFNLLWLAPIGFGLLIIGVVVAQALRELPSVQAFIENIRAISHRRTACKAFQPGRTGSISSICS
jgi:hypothetical protein